MFVNLKDIPALRFYSLIRGLLYFKIINQHMVFCKKMVDIMKWVTGYAINRRDPCSQKCAYSYHFLNQEGKLFDDPQYSPELVPRYYLSFTNKWITVWNQGASQHIRCQLVQFPEGGFRWRGKKAFPRKLIFYDIPALTSRICLVVQPSSNIFVLLFYQHSAYLIHNFFCKEWFLIVNYKKNVIHVHTVYNMYIYIHIYFNTPW